MSGTIKWVVPFLTHDQGVYLRQRMQESLPTLLVTTGNRTLMVDMDRSEITDTAKINMERFRGASSLEDWAIAMCHIVDERLDDGIVNGAAMLLCNGAEWCDPSELKCTIFHITKTAINKAQLFVGSPDPDMLRDHLIPPGTSKKLQ